jgi:ketosteroid isomerase-like protein
MRPITALLVILCFGCRSNDGQLARECIENLIAADNKSDLNGVLDSYDDNAELWPPHGERIIGKAAIRKNYENIFAKGRMELVTLVMDVFVERNYATVTGYNTGRNLYNDGTTKEVNGKYVAILTNDSTGKWRVLKLIWNDND